MTPLPFAPFSRTQPRTKNPRNPNRQQISLLICLILYQITNRTIFDQATVYGWLIETRISGCGEWLVTPATTKFSKKKTKKAIDDDNQRRKSKQQRRGWLGFLGGSLSPKNGSTSGLGRNCVRQEYGGIRKTQQRGVGERLHWKDDLVASSQRIARPILVKEAVVFLLLRHFRVYSLCLSLLYTKKYEQLFLCLLIIYKLNPPGLLYCVHFSMYYSCTQYSYTCIVRNFNTFWAVISEHPGVVNHKFMEKGRNDVKNEIGSDVKSFFEQPSNMTNSEQSETRPAMVEETKRSSARKELFEASSPGTKKEKAKDKLKLGMAVFLAKLFGAKLVICLDKKSSYEQTSVEQSSHVKPSLQFEPMLTMVEEALSSVAEKEQRQY